MSAKTPSREDGCLPRGRTPRSVKGMPPPFARALPSARRTPAQDGWDEGGRCRCWVSRKLSKKKPVSVSATFDFDSSVRDWRAFHAAFFPASRCSMRINATREMSPTGATFRLSRDTRRRVVTPGKTTRTSLSRMCGLPNKEAFLLVIALALRVSRPLLRAMAARLPSLMTTHFHQS